MSNKWKNRIVKNCVVNPSTLKANPDNWREHPVFQRESINGVLDQVGWVQSVIVNKNTGNIVDGHLRVEEAIKNKEDVPVVYVDLTEDEEKLILTTIDPIAAMAETNSNKLNELIDSFQVSNSDLDFFIESLKTGMPDFSPATMDDQGKLDELSPKFITCPHCKAEFDTRLNNDID